VIYLFSKDIVLSFKTFVIANMIVFHFNQNHYLDFKKYNKLCLMYYYTNVLMDK